MIDLTVQTTDHNWAEVATDDDEDVDDVVFVRLPNDDEREKRVCTSACFNLI